MALIAISNRMDRDRPPYRRDRGLSTARKSERTASRDDVEQKLRHAAAVLLTLGITVNDDTIRRIAAENAGIYTKRELNFIGKASSLRQSC